MRFTDAQTATKAANPKPTTASRSSEFSHCFRPIKDKLENKHFYIVFSHCYYCNSLLHGQSDIVYITKRKSNQCFIGMITPKHPCLKKTKLKSFELHILSKQQSQEESDHKRK